MRPRAAVFGDERRVRPRTRFQTRKAGRPRHARRLFHAARVAREAGFAFPRAAEGSMWTNWMARILASHDEADYAAARHAQGPALGAWEVTVLRVAPGQAEPPAQRAPPGQP